MKFSYTLTATAIALSALAGNVFADTIKISGASTVFNVVVQGAKDKVEKATGHTLQVVSSATGKGLVDLFDGAVDIAMVSEPMDIAGEAAEAAGKKIDTKAVTVFELKKDEIVFVVHPSNPVSKLSWDQVKDIHTGKINNWKAVGGADKPIVLYADSVTGGTRAMIHQILMGKADWAPGTKSQSSVKRAAEMVAGDEAGIAGVGKGFVEAGKEKIIDTKKFERPLTLVTKGAPNAAQKAVIDAFIKEAK